MKAVVDRIESGIAVLLVGEAEEQVNIPLHLLPSGTHEGSWLTISFEPDIQGEQQQRDKISSLLEKLKNKNKD